MTQAEGADRATERLANAATSMGGIIGLIQNIRGKFINTRCFTVDMDGARIALAKKC